MKYKSEAAAHTSHAGSSPKTVAAPVPKARSKPLASPSVPSKPALKIPPILLEGDEPVQPAPSVPAPPPARLPQSYGISRLSLMARDPHWLYAHWDLAPESRKRYLAEAESRRLVVRHWPAASGGAAFSETEVHPESHHWFLHAREADASYAAELGYYGPGRQWVSVAHSGPVTTPPDNLAAEKQVRLATMPAPGAAWVTSTVPPVLPGRMKPAPALLRLLLPEFPLAFWQETVPVLEALALPPELEAKLQKIQAVLQAHPQALKGEFPLTTVEWTPEHEQALAELMTWTEQHHLSVDSAALQELVRKQLEKAGPAAQAAGPAAAPSSPLGGAPGPKPGFWFNLNTELVVYGSTQPGAQVLLEGQPVPLQPDGSFSLRFALPDGHYSLPVVAVSPEGERREARLEFERHTGYQGPVGVHPQDPALQPPGPPRPGSGA